MKTLTPRSPLASLASLALLAACSKGTHSSEASAVTAPVPPVSAVSAAPAPALPPEPASPEPHRYDVAFESAGLHLRGWVVRAPGAPPRPVIVYNHGSEQRVEWETYGDLASWLVLQGYVVFFPFRRGVDGSDGSHLDAEQARAAGEDRDRLVVDHLVAENDDVTAAITWIRGQSYVDPKRVAVAGCSFGGIETLLSAERAPAIYAAVDFAGASATWASSPLLQERMTAAAHGARVPVMFVQAKNDYNTAPSEVLSAAMRADGKDGELRIYPPRGPGPREGHGFCVTGMTTWGPDVVAFLNAKEPR